MLPFTMGSTQYIAISNHVDFTPSTGLDYSLPDTKVYRFDPSTGIIQPPIAVLDTSGAMGLEHFTIGTDHYLAVANHGGGVGPFNINNYLRKFHIYKWYPSQNNGIGGFDSDASVAGVTPLQEIGKLGPTDIEFFEEGGAKYLAIGAHYKNNLNPSTIEILPWNSATGRFGTTAQEVQQFGVDSVYRITHFRIAGELYLGIANHLKETSTGFSTSTKSRIYKWSATANGGSPGFALHQEISTVSAHDMEFFTIDGINYLAIASHDDTPQKSKIYRWNPSTAQFDTTNNVQEFPGQSAVDIEYFQYGAYHYFVQSQSSAYPARTTDIYKWNGTKFEIELAQLPGITQGQRVEHFFMGNSLYLTVANFNIPQYTNGVLTPDYSIDSKVFRLE